MQIISSCARAFGVGWLFADLEKAAAYAWEILISSYELASSQPSFAEFASRLMFMILLPLKLPLLLRIGA